MEILLILVGVAVPVALYFWRESRFRNPASRWPALASAVGMQYAPDPPRMGGEWKGRRVTVSSVEGGALLASPLQCRSAIRVEIGPRAEMERAAGMVVHDRLTLGDPAFEERYLARATPPEAGEGALDPATRQKLLRMPDVRILAVSNQIQVRMPSPTEADALRGILDVAASVADAVEG
ncbi:MAG: hypothetical protein ABII00_03125 [Elusimicrobiota bacterium]